VHALALLAAAATWSAPQTVSAPHTFAGPLFASSDQQGNVLAAWGWQDGVGQSAPTGAGQVRVSGRTVSSEERAPKGLVAAQAYGDGRFLELSSKQIDARGRRWQLSVKDGDATTRLATAFILFRPQLSVAPDGTAIAAWVELHGNRHVVRVSTRSRTGRFSKPVTVIAQGQTTLVTTAVSEHGDALVGVVRDRRVLVRVRRPRAPWGRLTELSRAQVKTNWQLSAAFDNARAVFVWRRHRFSRPGHPDIKALDAATLATGATRWSARQRLEADGARSPALGDGVLTYTQGPNSAATARVRALGPDGRFGAPLDAAPPQGGLRSVSAASDGGRGLVVGWVIPTPSGDGGGIGYAAALDANSTAFGPREQVTPNEATFDMRLVRSAGAIRAFWTARPEGTGPSVPIANVHTLVRTAVRSQ
jgi:hypothetical protein